MKYQLCMFDLDGTLLNTVGALTYSTNAALRELGLGEVTPEQVKRIVGDGYRMQMERALKLCGDEKLIFHEASLPLYMKYFSENCMRDVVPYEGIRELLCWLKEQKIKIAVFSNKPQHQAVENVEQIFGAGYFDAIRGETSGILKKPAPDGAWMLCRELGIKPENTLYLGDTATDMKTGISAGIDTAGVTWGYRERKELMDCGPMAVVDHPLQIRELVERSK